MLAARCIGVGCLDDHRIWRSRSRGREIKDWLRELQSLGRGHALPDEYIFQWIEGRHVSSLAKVLIKQALLGTELETRVEQVVDSIGIENVLRVHGDSGIGSGLSECWQGE